MANIDVTQDASLTTATSTDVDNDRLFLAQGGVLKDLAPKTLIGNLAGYGCAGLVGTNNAGTPNTQYDFVADLVVLRNATSTVTAVRTNTGTVTNNVSTAGPAANGRDQSGAFSAGSWVHFYFIWNGTTLATVSSAAAPPTGPTLPTGYTHWAYLGAIYFNGSSQLLPTRIVGNKVYYKSAIAALAAGSATTPTAVSLTAIVPPNAQTVLLSCTVGFNGTAAQSNIALLQFVSGSNMYAQSIVAQVNAVQQYIPAALEMPVISQQIFYSWSTATGTKALYIDVYGYSVPNYSS
jgi:hypothetical protein